METSTTNNNTTSGNIPSKMKAYVLTKAISTEDWKISEFPTPTIDKDDVLVKVKAFGVNFADCSQRKAQYNDAPPFPYVPGYEVAGIVAQVGSSVKDFKIGDRVFGFASFGGYAEYCKVPQEGCVPLPKDWTFTQGAGFLVCFVTAYHCLFVTGPLFEKSKVLIHACMGGLGLACIQLCKYRKCEIFGTCGSDEKVKLCESFGVNHPINYATSDFESAVKQITNGEGVDIVIDSVGGSMFKKDIEILKAGGRVVGCGAANFSDRSIFKAFTSLLPQLVSMLTLSAVGLLLNCKSFCGVNMKILSDKNRTLFRHELEELLRLIKEGAITPLPTTEYDWSEVGKAHHLMEARKTTGKLVILIPDEKK